MEFKTNELNLPERKIDIYQRRIISFEIHATNTGVISILREIRRFLDDRTNWATTSLKSEVIKK